MGWLGRLGLRGERDGRPLLELPVLCRELVGVCEEDGVVVADHGGLGVEVVEHVVEARFALLKLLLNFLDGALKFPAALVDLLIELVKVLLKVVAAVNNFLVDAVELLLVLLAAQIVVFTLSCLA